MILVLAEAAAIQEVPVDERAVLVLLEHDIGHRHHGRHVGARADRDPLCIQDGGGIRIDRVEDDELDAGVLPLDSIVCRVAEGGPGRVVAEGHDIVAVQEVQAVVVAVVVVAAVAPAEYAGCVPAAPGAGRPRVQIVDVQLVQQAVRLAAQREDRVVAVGAVDALDLIVDILRRLVPGDALPLVLASELGVGVVRTPVLALHGVFQAVQTSRLILLRIASQAGSLLTVHAVVGVEVVSALADNDTVLDTGADQTLAAAVVPAGRRDPLAAFGSVCDRRLAGRGHTLSCSHRVFP